ncbi:helix-turn-helix domain-containing protein [Shimwellia pseudoproteus]|nr:helix-turn-helix domain-containing protein [Shimwellia pseudoproteus]MBJ3816117.1 helix-turn-helix domain-containing protein [Shimwellia pseudoproteus]
MVTLESLITEVAEWIEKNIHKPLTIDDVAAHAGYSKWHLQRVFFKVKHVGLGTWIRNRKLAHAAHDLIHSQDNVIDICFRYGYDSQQSFSRTFSKRYHVPPFKFRKLNTPAAFCTAECHQQH